MHISGSLPGLTSTRFQGHTLVVVVLLAVVFFAVVVIQLQPGVGMSIMVVAVMEMKGCDDAASLTEFAASGTLLLLLGLVISLLEDFSGLS